MVKRRNPFDIPILLPTRPAPANIYETIPVATPRRRNRQWEKEHLNDKATYRGVDPKLALRVKTIAADLLVPSGEVARAVIEFALRAYEAGELSLHPRPNPYRLRMTLFPASGSAHSTNQSKQSNKGKPHAAMWRVITTWRSFPYELKEQLAALACEDELHVPIGELITALLRFGLQAYDRGRLTLQAVQKSGAFTLERDGKR
jgi:hypothetical protein